MGWLDEEDYLEAAQALPLGRDKRIGHWCGEGQVLKIEHSAKGYHAYCFRCGDRGFTAKVRQTLSQFDFMQQQAAQEQLALTMELPNDFTTEIPTSHAVWLYRAGISIATGKQCGFGYSESLGRVVLPVYDSNGVLVYLQARATNFPAQQPKYLNLAGANKGAVCYTRRPDNDLLPDTVVLTEDILSCTRIGEVQFAKSLLGTKLSDGQAMSISESPNVIWWLDGDKAGISGSTNGSRKLQFLVDNQRIIRTPNDPKAYSSRQIRHILLREGDYDYDIL